MSLLRSVLGRFRGAARDATPASVAVSAAQWLARGNAALARLNLGFALPVLGSRSWPGSAATPPARTNSPRRLQFEPRTHLVSYYRLYERVDVSLDAYPYGGATTTLDSLMDEAGYARDCERALRLAWITECEASRRVS